ncbi:MAG: hypothetical protein HY332_20285 [Chloroflexi bacterium]|nr:hypothetical protein [Chloroflexota bacterium]
MGFPYGTISVAQRAQLGMHVALGRWTGGQPGQRRQYGVVTPLALSSRRTTPTRSACPRAAKAHAQPFGYAGEQRDATGLLYLRARMYDPMLGRFLQRDPFVGLQAAPLTLNRFA